jgi:hypothetical protein
MRRAVLIAALLATAAPAWAQQGTLPAEVLDRSRHVPISNGLISAQIFPPGEGELYKGTRFDHAGVVMHVTYRGQNYTDYWFDRFVTDPSDTSRRPIGTQTSCCAVSGPVEEFAAVGFEEAGMGGRFLKPGIGIFKRDSDNPLQFPTLPVLNEGTRSFKSGKNDAVFVQDLQDKESGYGYHYTKTVTLVPGKPQMTIGHVLKNTGDEPIVTTVYCHNFLTLSPGSEHMAVTAPFVWRAEKPLQPDLVKLDGTTIRYIAPIPRGETTISLMHGFGTSVSDYDFTITNTRTGFGQRIRGDQPMVKINMWSINTTYRLEPYIAIALKPGETKRWSYTYDFYGPGEKP